MLSALLKRSFGLSQWENVYKISIGSISESKPCKSTKQVVSLYNFIWSIQRKLSRSFHLIASPSLSNRAEILYCNLPPVTFCAVAFVWQLLQVVFVQVTLFCIHFEIQVLAVCGMNLLSYIWCWYLGIVSLTFSLQWTSLSN